MARYSAHRLLAAAAALLVAVPLATPLPSLAAPQRVLVQPPPPQVPRRAAPAPEDPQVELIERLDLERDRTERLTVPVSVAGRGPYSFIVDTGSERTVIARELARELQLAPGRSATMHSMTEVSEVGTVVIPELEVGRRTVNEIHAPALSRRHLGAEGMLGVDTLQSQRVEFDFVTNQMRVTPSRRAEARWPSDSIVVSARSRYGHLMLVDASFEGERVYVIIDTGSQVSVANDALRRRLQRRGRLGVLRPLTLISVTGGRVEAQYGVASRIRIGDAVVRNLPVAFAEVHPFRQLQLTEHPALLLGMDALQLFDRVSVDFARRRVRLLPRPTSQRDAEQQVAAASRSSPVAG